MRRHKLTHNGQTQSRSTGLAAARPVHPIEAVKDVGQLCGGNTFPGIAHINLNAAFDGRHVHDDRSTTRRVAQRIVEQIGQHLAQPLLIT